MNYDIFVTMKENTHTFEDEKPSSYGYSVGDLSFDTLSKKNQHLSIC